MITQTPLTTAFYDDPFERPATPPDSPLRETFSPKKAAHLRHIVPPPGIEPVTDCRGRPRQEGATDRLSFREKEKPRVPPKPADLAILASKLSQQGRKVERAPPAPVSTHHGSCSQRPEFCLNSCMLHTGETNDLNPPSCHCHKTLYRRELRDGIPVEVISHICEISLSHAGEAGEMECPVEGEVEKTKSVMTDDDDQRVAGNPTIL